MTIVKASHLLNLILVVTPESNIGIMQVNEINMYTIVPN